MQYPGDGTVVVLGTGGTIAGAAASPGDQIGYRAGSIGVEALVAAIPELAGTGIEVEQVAQVDSKDMDFGLWRVLAARVAHHVARAEVCGVVVTHGTDTLEETAWFLQRVLAPARPVLLTAAMRPATALAPDGPQNMLDAVRVARAPGARGVVAVIAGRVHAAGDVRKTHPYRLDAFDSGDAGPLAHVEEGRLRQHRDWPVGDALGLDRLPAQAADWPWIEIVTSHAGADGRGVRGLCRAGVDGIVVAGTGNGTLHHVLEAALLDAQAAGIMVWRCTRCQDGRVIDPPGGAALPSAGAMTPVQARVEMMLRLMKKKPPAPD